MDEEVTTEDQQKWQHAVLDYMNFHNMKNPEHLKFNVDLVKKMIKHVSVRDDRWKGFPETTFNSNGAIAEKTLYHAIKRKIEAMKNERKKQLGEQLAKKQKTKISEEAQKEAKQIIAEEQLPKVVTNTVANAIEIGLSNCTTNAGSGKNVSHKRRSRAKNANADSASSKSADDENAPQMNPSESALQASWLALQKKKREYKWALKHHRQLRSSMAYIKTPTSS